MVPGRTKMTAVSPPKRGERAGEKKEGQGRQMGKWRIRMMEGRDGEQQMIARSAWLPPFTHSRSK